MSESNKKDGVVNSAPVTNAVPAAPAPVDTNAALTALLQLLLKKEERTLQEDATKLAAMEARSAQRVKSGIARDSKLFLKQARCRHEKGGVKGPRAGVVDFNVFMHTYVDGTSIIKCNSCGMKWKQQDTPEFLVRNGKQIANHTKIGWAQALDMVHKSTNRPSSSEVPMQAKPVGAVTPGTTADVDTASDFTI